MYRRLLLLEEDRRLTQRRCPQVACRRSWQWVCAPDRTGANLAGRAASDLGCRLVARVRPVVPIILARLADGASGSRAHRVDRGSGNVPQAQETHIGWTARVQRSYVPKDE
jgi:hypothetical protein